MKICPACSREYANEHTHCRDDGVVLVHLDTGTGERAQDLIGQIVDGRYRVERIVGRGGMGTVYACRHVVVGKAFAMKVLRPGIERSEEILQRFIREAQAANSVQSRHICEMTDFGQLPGGAFYVVMELLQGMSLTRALREKKLSRSQIKHVFIQIAETLEKAHKANIIHRDLKPDNVVLVHDDGDPHFVKLVDFGIAKMLQSKASNLTETGVILGTPYYMSPEQARGDPVDHRSDIYAVGVMMYRAFTGRLPFVADTAMGVLTRHLTEMPELPSRIAEMDASLERLILRCLEKKPIDRFQSMADVAEALRSVSDAPRAKRLADHPTIDERSEPLRAAHLGPSEAPISMPTPTRVATPQARSARMPQGSPDGASAAAAPAGAHPPSHGPRDARHASFPPPLPSPAPAAAAPAQAQTSGEHARPPAGVPHDPVAAWQGASGEHSPMSSGLATPPGMHPYDPALHGGEAATNRGLVSSRMASLAPPRSSRIALWVGAAVAAVSVIAVSAIALYPNEEQPAAVGAGESESAVQETAGEAVEELDPPWEDANPIKQPDAEPEASASASASDATRRPPRPGPARGPKPPTPAPKPEPEPEEEKPQPEIRSPFD